MEFRRFLVTGAPAEMRIKSDDLYREHIKIAEEKLKTRLGDGVTRRVAMSRRFYAGYEPASPEEVPPDGLVKNQNGLFVVGGRKAKAKREWDNFFMGLTLGLEKRQEEATKGFWDAIGIPANAHIASVKDRMLYTCGVDRVLDKIFLTVPNGIAVPPNNPNLTPMKEWEFLKVVDDAKEVAHGA